MKYKLFLDVISLIYSLMYIKKPNTLDPITHLNGLKIQKSDTAFTLVASDFRQIWLLLVR